MIVKTLAAVPDRTYAGLGQLLLAKAQQHAREQGFSAAIHALVRDVGPDAQNQREVRAADASLHAFCQGSAAMNVAEILQSHAQRHPTEVALIDVQPGSRAAHDVP